MTVSAFSSLSLDPTLVLLCLDRRSRTLAGLDYSDPFNVNVLGAGQRELANHFATRASERPNLEDHEYRVNTAEHRPARCPGDGQS